MSVLEYQNDTATIGKGLDVDVSELLFVLGPIQDSELEALESHLASKYQLH